MSAPCRPHLFRSVSAKVAPGQEEGTLDAGQAAMYLASVALGDVGADLPPLEFAKGEHA
jgi:hypothetical protein